MYTSPIIIYAIAYRTRRRRVPITDNDTRWRTRVGVSNETTRSAGPPPVSHGDSDLHMRAPVWS